jgi:hypothetical protein
MEQVKNGISEIEEKVKQLDQSDKDKEKNRI